MDEAKNTGAAGRFAAMLQEEARQAGGDWECIGYGNEDDARVFTVRASSSSQLREVVIRIDFNEAHGFRWGRGSGVGRTRDLLRVYVHPGHTLDPSDEARFLLALRAFLAQPVLAR